MASAPPPHRVRTPTRPTTTPAGQAPLWFAVPWPVLLIAGLMVAGLLALSGAYGFHGDEM
ncbi:MAG: hypothetical protein ACLQBX_05960 [Candidatus Limnocylindrales bacterium]|jgi:hypothetical protein